MLAKAVDGNNLSWHIERIGAWASKERHPSTPKLEYGKKEEEEDIEEEE